MKMTIQEVIDKLDEIARAKDTVDRVMLERDYTNRCELDEVKDLLSEYAARILISKVEI